MVDSVLLTNAKHNLSLLHKAVELLEPRFATRALRSLPALRKKLGDKGHAEDLAEVIRNSEVFAKDSPRKQVLLDYLGNPAVPVPEAAPMEVDDDTAAASTKPKEPTTTKAPAAVVVEIKKPEGPLAALPEGDVYLSLLVVLWLLDQKKYSEGKALSSELIETMTALNRRTMDQLASKVYFYWVRLHELNGDDTAVLRTQVPLSPPSLPILTRLPPSTVLSSQPNAPPRSTTFPTSTAGNAQLARWYYYLGRIRAIQLSYTEAHTSLQQSIRRSPDAKSAPGFLQTAHKLSIVVELLMGEIPERRTFRHPVLRLSLLPYLSIVQAVRTGDLEQFNSSLATHATTFQSDGNYSLILRLRHNVIKTALRTISLAYSRISLRDVSAKLHLDSEEDAEYIVAKAIRDGVIDAVVDHEQGFMRSKEVGDVYATSEPQVAFDTRIKFLLELHNQSVKAMRYPLNAHSKELASAGEARERERELAKEIEDADEDASDGPGDMEGF
ncbi:hypothetical protein RQP46_010564 [Phenoliferia psychrophenolica]